MVYIHSWHEFQDAAESLYEQDPNKTRYCVKWKSSEGKLVLKITNDVTCLKFKTYSSIFLNRFEALNLGLIEKMQNRQRPIESAATSTPATTAAAAGAGAAEDSASTNNAPAAAASSTANIQSTGPKAGGVKKKKGKKK